MKYTLIFLLSFFLSGCNLLPGSKSKSGSESQDLVIDHTLAPVANYDYTYPLNILPSRNESANLPEFYPIGFSPSGSFAFILRPCNGGCGCCTHNLVIQNLLNDKMETIYEIRKSDFDIAVHEKDWKTDFNNIRKKLMLSDISQSKFKLNTESVFFDANGDHRYQIIVNQFKKESQDPNAYGSGMKLTYSVVVKMDDFKTKKISFGEVENGISLEYLGFLRSPYNDQLAVVFNKKSFGFEAEVDNDIIIVGCNLNPIYFK